jgi:hypothetical protein
MIRKNITVSIVTIENNNEETLIDLKSSNDRTCLILEPRISKLVLNLQELKNAISVIEDFSVSNPNETQNNVDNIMLVEFDVDSEMSM